jgi:hypothetical protein
MCIDYCALNKIIINNYYLLAWIDDLLDQLHGAKYFRQIDLKSKYYQIHVMDEDVEKMIMRTKSGSYKFLMMPFGLCNVSSMFTTLMNSISMKSWMNSWSSILMISLCILRWHRSMQNIWNMFWISFVKTNSLPIGQKMNLLRRRWTSWDISYNGKGWGSTPISCKP